MTPKQRQIEYAEGRRIMRAELAELDDKATACLCMIRHFAGRVHGPFWDGMLDEASAVVRSALPHAPEVRHG
jgi:hypothetical protein